MSWVLAFVLVLNFINTNILIGDIFNEIKKIKEELKK